MKLNKTQQQTALFILLLVIAGGLFWFNRSKITKTAQKKSAVNSATAGNQGINSDFPVGSVPPGDDIFGKTNVDLPIVLQNQSEGSLLIHYFINGSVKQVTGSQIILDTPNKTIPAFTITSDTRVSKISPPYGQSSSVPISLKDLKPGNNVTISVEYDLVQKQWLVRDVFLPTDHN